MNLDEAFSGDGIEQKILRIIAHLSTIFHDNLRFLNYGNGYMYTLNEMGTHELSCLQIFYKDPEEMGGAITLNLTFTPYQLIGDLITIEDEEPGNRLRITFLDGDCFEFNHYSWQLKENTLQMIWSWEREEIFEQIERLATKLIEFTVGPVSIA